MFSLEHRLAGVLPVLAKVQDGGAERRVARQFTAGLLPPHGEPKQNQRNYSQRR